MRKNGADMLTKQCQSGELVKLRDIRHYKNIKGQVQSIDTEKGEEE